MIASEADMKNSADIGGCYLPQLLASVDNNVLDLQNSSYPTRPHSIIANYTTKAVVFNKKGHLQPCCHSKARSKK